MTAASESQAVTALAVATPLPSMHQACQLHAVPVLCLCCAAWVLEAAPGCLPSPRLRAVVQQLTSRVVL